MSAGSGKALPDRSRRAIRRTRRGDKKAEQIRSAATDLFLRHGFDGVSVDEIVQAVGGSKTNIYNHFHNKEGLFVAIVEGLCDDLLESFVTIDVSGLGAAEGLRSLALALLGILLQDRHLAFQRIIIAESARFPALGRAWFDSGPERARGIIAQFMERQQRAGRLRDGDPHQMAIFFHDMVATDLLNRAMLGEKASDSEIRQRIDTAVEVFLHGFART